MVAGVIWRDGVTEPLPPVRRVLGEVVEMLRGKGVEVVDMDAVKLRDYQGLANKFLVLKGGIIFWI